MDEVADPVVAVVLVVGLALVGLVLVGLTLVGLTLVGVTFVGVTFVGVTLVGVADDVMHLATGPAGRTASGPGEGAPGGGLAGPTVSRVPSENVTVSGVAVRFDAT